jgi:hypothetical protein
VWSQIGQELGGWADVYQPWPCSDHSLNGNLIGGINSFDEIHFGGTPIARSSGMRKQADVCASSTASSDGIAVRHVSAASGQRE